MIAYDKKFAQTRGYSMSHGPVAVETRGKQLGCMDNTKDECPLSVSDNGFKERGSSIENEKG